MQQNMVYQFAKKNSMPKNKNKLYAFHFLRLLLLLFLLLNLDFPAWACLINNKNLPRRPFSASCARKKNISSYNPFH